MKEYQHLKEIKSLDQLNHECTGYLELRKRIKGKGFAYGNQCQFCGDFRGNEISKSKVQHPVPECDTNLNEIFIRKRKELLDEFIESQPLIRNNENILEDRIKLLTDIIERFCGENNTNSRSLVPTYLNRQRESHLNSLYVSRWNNEDELHNWFKEIFSEWFEVFHEVKGEGYINRETKNIRIDFVIKAKPILLKHGFTSGYIGVEVKYLNPLTGNGFHGKSSRGIFQALSYWYAGARWNLLDEQNVELESVLVFSNLSFDDEKKIVFETNDSHFKKVWRSYFSVANHANVGELTIKSWNGNMKSWSMEYNGTKYFSMSKRDGFKKGNENVIGKRRIGSSK